MSSNNAMFLTRFEQDLNEQKINELYFEYKEKIYGLVLSYVKDNYLAEDLSHEILLKCYLTRNRFNGECSIPTWMHRIAINHCIDFLRKRSRQRELLHEQIDLLNQKELRTPEFEAITSCDKEELRSKIKQLPLKYEKVITLYYIKERTLKEIEQDLNIKLPTIKTRLFRAKHMLREMY
ncbi:sigma-70 family RNA polymerase sigma factor [Sutcliffiella deserti]|uniref:sigma-70 family RNA polymerase sigma factor n=1 Tax=Sutcliffiella deserti TaxID=2875501 RepID=UPI001CBE76E1|nr:sigma-70 family RNA polymerase sigma factor [Sutcliffiella deserti]